MYTGSKTTPVFLAVLDMNSVGKISFQSVFGTGDSNKKATFKMSRSIYSTYSQEEIHVYSAPLLNISPHSGLDTSLTST